MNRRSLIVAGALIVLGLSSCSDLLTREATVTRGVNLDVERHESNPREVPALEYESARADALARFDDAESLDEAVAVLADLVRVSEGTDTSAEIETEVVLFESDLVGLAMRFGTTADGVLRRTLDNPVIRDYFGDAPYVVPDLSEAGRSGWDQIDTALGAAEGSADDQVFWEPVLAELHSGPWGDHLLGRCLDASRTRAVYSRSAHGGRMRGTDTEYAYVVQRATFRSVAEAEASFGELDLCHVNGAVSQFVEALGWYGYDVAMAPNAVSAEIGQAQVLDMSFDLWDLPIRFRATLIGTEVSTVIGYCIDPVNVSLAGGVMPSSTTNSISTPQQPELDIDLVEHHPPAVMGLMNHRR